MNGKIRVLEKTSSLLANDQAQTPGWVPSD
jgi:hypothetical protein